MLERQKEILLILLKSNGYLSVDSLAKRLDCSEKTIRNDLKMLDEWLGNYPKVEIIRKPSVGIFLNAHEIDRKELLQEVIGTEQHDISQNERRNELIKILLKADKVHTMQQLANLFYVSKSTIGQDLIEVEHWMRSFDLRLVRKPNLGLKVEGEEKAWRTALSKVIDVSANQLSFVSLQENVLQEVISSYDYSLIETEIRKIERALDFQFTDQAMTNLTIHLAIAVKRIKLGYGIIMPQEELVELQEKKEYALALQLAESLERILAVKIPNDEVGYMTLHLLGARFHYDHSMEHEHVEESLQKIDSEALSASRMIIQKAAEVIDVSLLEDKELLIGLSVHLHATLNRLRHGLSVSNPMLKEIKKMYRYPFDLIFSFIPEIENAFKISLPEDEVAYITLHVQAALERVQKQQQKITKALIVCPTGTGTSQLLKAKLERYFSNLMIVDTVSTFQLKKKIEQKNPDVLISTVPLKNRDLPSLTVTPLLLEYEREKLKNFLKELHSPFPEKETAYPLLKTLVSEELIFLDVDFNDRFDVISYLGEQLSERGYVHADYGTSSTEREKISSTVIGGGIAIPHGDPQLIGKSVIGIARLNKEIEWEGEKITFVFMLANKLSDKEEVKQLFKELANLVEDEDKLNELRKQKNTRDFYKTL
ncbi:BglG family transcription antiterminator [Bacillus taeanensis]|uniref:PTS modulated transcriptional regulator MtlR family protein n=1 Tax=Bacillus taeanensis TaxID=273032 RepID=A0A366XXK1_9BACI|nr:BglG family transcription antiterminator [Bacillus taeanensis]RBW68864.1 PTS modulated transcriptional regulator MtlR family protein [Bacillus taeanensis]